MKWLPFTVGALLFVLAAAIGISHYLTDSAERVCRELTEVEQALWREDWPRAESGLERAENEWRQLQGKWAKLIDHKEMEDIEISFVDLRGAVRRKDRNEALKEQTELVFFLRHTPDAERPGWENIL